MTKKDKHFRHTPKLIEFEDAFKFVKDLLENTLSDNDIRLKEHAFVNFNSSIEKAALGITCGYRYCVQINEKLDLIESFFSILTVDNKNNSSEILVKIERERNKYKIFNNICQISHSEIKGFFRIARDFLILIGIWKKSEDYIDSNEEFWVEEWDIEYYRILWRARYVKSYEEFYELCHCIGICYLSFYYNEIWGIDEKDLKKIWCNIDLLRDIKWEIN